MMPHEEASLRLAELAEGRLEEPTRSAVAEHLAGCEECRAWDAAYRLFAAVLGEGVGAVSSAEHPSSEALARHALDPEGLLKRAPDGAVDEVERDEVASHLDKCAECSELMTTTRQAVEASRRRPPALRSVLAFAERRAAGSKLAMAAAASLLLVSSVALLYQASRLSGERSQLERWSGPVDFLLLADAERGAADPPTLETRAGQPYALLAVDPPEQAASAELAVRFSIRDRAGETVWARTAAPGEIGRLVDERGGVFLHVPATLLPPGDYELRLGLGESSEPILARSFRVVQAD